MPSLAARTARSVIGTVIVLVALPLLFVGGGLWIVAQHRGDGEAYTAVTELVQTDGYAVLAEDVDKLLRADIPVARGGQTRLTVSASGDGGPLFLGIGPRTAVRRYLASTSYARVDRIRPAKGPIPVDVAEISGPGAPAGRPFEQSFWLATSTGLTRDGRVEDSLSWTPAAVRDQELAFVVMNADASTTLEVRLAVAMVPGWLVPAMWGFLVFGGTLLALGALALAWPAPATRTVYVVEPKRLRQLMTGVLSDAGPQTVEPQTPEPEASRLASAREDGTAGKGAVGDEKARRAGTRGWTQLFTAARPPATPRLLWPPRRADRRATVPPIPAAPIARPAPLGQASAGSGPRSGAPGPGSGAAALSDVVMPQSSDGVARDPRCP